MMVAFLRGFLRPHVNGLQSFIREQVIITAISHEHTAEMLQTKAIIESNQLPGLTPTGQVQTLRRFMTDLAEVTARKMLLSERQIALLRGAVHMPKEAKQMESLVNVLRQSDFADMMRRNMDAYQSDFI